MDPQKTPWSPPKTEDASKDSATSDAVDDHTGVPSSAEPSDVTTESADTSSDMPASDPVADTPDQTSEPGDSSASSEIIESEATVPAASEPEAPTPSEGSQFGSAESAAPAATPEVSSPDLAATPASEISGADAPAPVGMAAAVATPSTPPPSTADSMSMGGAAGMAAAPKPKRKKLMMLAIIVIAAVVVLLGAAASAYYYVINKPQNVLGMALQNSFSDKITSVAFDGQVQVKPKDSTVLSASFAGKGNQSGAFDISGTADAVITKVTFDARSLDGSTYYVKVGGLAGLPELLAASGDSTATALAPLINTVDNQWIEINQSIIKQFTGSDTSINTKLSASDRQKIYDAYKKNQFLTVQKTLATETIKGQASYHYQVVADATKLKAFVAAIKSANLSIGKLTQDDIASINKQIDSAHLSKYPFDVWISKGNRYIDQVGFNVASDGDTATLKMALFDYNKSVTVVKPANSKSLLEIISKYVNQSALTGLMSGGLPTGISL